MGWWRVLLPSMSLASKKEETAQNDLFMLILSVAFFKDYNKKSYLIFCNEGECAAYNIKIHGLDQFFVKPVGAIPPLLDVSEISHG